MEIFGTPFVCTNGADGSPPLTLMPDPPKDVDRNFAPAGRLIDPAKAAQAKKAGEAMMKVMRDFEEPLSVQDARDACSFCRTILESQVRGCPYNDAALEAEEDMDAVANVDESVT